MNRFLTFVIGLLFGAIITTIGFIFYIKGMNGIMDMRGPGENAGMYRPEGEMDEPPQKPNGEMGNMQNYMMK